MGDRALARHPALGGLPRLGRVMTRFYSTAAWQKIAKAQLAPMCQGCDSAPATVVDHIVPITNGGQKRERANLQSLCRVCHQEKTNREKAGITWIRPSTEDATNMAIPSTRTTLGTLSGVKSRTERDALRHQIAMLRDRLPPHEATSIEIVHLEQMLCEMPVQPPRPRLLDRRGASKSGLTRNGR